MCNIDLTELDESNLVLLATTTAIELAKNKSCEEIALISNFLSQICCTLSTIKCQRAFLEKNCSNCDKERNKK